MILLRPKQLPESEWPAEDLSLWDIAFAEGDVFDGAGPGAHLALSTRGNLRFGIRRWLGFLRAEHADDLLLPFSDRITPARVRAYVEHLSGQGTLSETSVAMIVTHLYNAARLLAADQNWSWLKTLKRRLHAQAHTDDRFDRLIPAHRTLDLGILLMQTADQEPPSGQMKREIQFRDGLIIAILSLWPIRRRSLAALTVDRHVRHSNYGHIELILFPEDTKSGRPETWPVPEIILPHMSRYLNEIRLRLGSRSSSAAVWLGQHGAALDAGGIYAAVCRRTMAAYGRPMALHDFRRAAATFLAMEAPEKVGLVPGILQHATTQTAERHYNLARSASASRRYGQVFAAAKGRLREVGGD